jgi:tetratricopeptide (TPR) repeat protein
VDEFRRSTMELTSIAGLGGLPQLVLPVGTSEDRAVCPVTVSLLGAPNADLFLLQTAEQLLPALSHAYRSCQTAYRENVAAAAAEAKAAAAAGAGSSSKDGAASGSAGPSSSSASPNTANKRRTKEEEQRNKAVELKEQGNVHFKSGRFPEAIEAYSGALRLDPSNATLYSNRAMAHIKLLDYPSAEADCDAALKIEPRSVKTLLRRGSARSCMGKFEDAAKDFEQVLRIEPENRQAKEELFNVRQMMRAMGIAPSPT